MKYLKSYKLFESYEGLSVDDYLKIVCKKAEHIFKEDNNWKNLKRFNDVKNFFELDSNADNTILVIADEYRDRVKNIIERDFRYHIISHKKEFDKIKNPIQKKNLLKQYIQKFPGFEDCLTNDYFNKVIDNITMEYNYPYAITHDFSDWFYETIDLSDIFIETLADNIVKGIAGKVATILKKKPSNFEILYNMDFAISDHIKTSLMNSDKMDFFTKTKKYNL